MNYWVKALPRGLVILTCALHTSQAQQLPPSHQALAASGRLLGGRADFDWEQLPPGAFKRQIQALPPRARERAEEWLRGFSFPPEDLDYLRADPGGGIYYVDSYLPDPVATDPSTADAPAVSGSSAPVSPFPTNLVFHSKPGSAQVLYLDFDGELVSGTLWNESLGRDPISAVAFSTDGDYTLFSDSEQEAIEQIWQRVAEDYAPFDLDVTTERPAVFDRWTAHLLVTRSTDAEGQGNPAAGSGGVAYINVFGGRSYDFYRPAWVYFNNLSSWASYIAEAASHEIGHNLGLSHDGKTDGTAYYPGHGSGDTSWAPIMGFGYYKNMTQWSRGEYYLANNPEDDVAIIAGKLTYERDDHGNTLAGASFLSVVNGTDIVSTTPATDPDNTRPENKGVIETEADVDLFSFSTGAGDIQLAVAPWVSPVSYRGGNLDIRLRLLDDTGWPVVTSDPAETTGASLAATVSEGQYYLEVSGTGIGDPLSSNPSGYPPYASVGQYFIYGTVVKPGGFIVPPQAQAAVSDILESGQGTQRMYVTYSDDVAIDVSTLDSADLRITGPNGYDQAATLVAVDLDSDGTPRTGTYQVLSPGAVWITADNGTYDILLLSNAVADTEGAFAAAQTLGQFSCAIAAPIYLADMAADPGWTLEGEWAYGEPQGLAGDPAAGYNGARVLGYNLQGPYDNRLSTVYATTPAIDCSSATETVVLRFRRWLGIQRGDQAVVEVSSNGSNWAQVWKSAGAVTDGEWKSVQYDMTSVAAGQATVFIRWGLSSNPDPRTSYGWNLDDVELLGSGGLLDTDPPFARLNAPNLEEGGNPNYAFTVVYTDNVAIAVSSLGETNLYVLGPHAYSNSAEFAGVDNPADGTPRTASYSVPAPNGTWSDSDNGDYEVYLRYNEVVDTSGNTASEGSLGLFHVNILPQWSLTSSSVPSNWGAVFPAGGVYRDGSTVSVTASPSNHFRFAAWQGDLAGTNPSAQLLMNAHKSVQGVFEAVLTTNHATPHWWLAQYGFTGRFEQAAVSIGTNGMAYWQSYLAGLDPDNPTSFFAVTAWRRGTNDLLELSWPTVSGRLYNVYHSTNLLGSFGLVPGSANIAWTTNRVTLPLAHGPIHYRLGVTLAE